MPDPAKRSDWELYDAWRNGDNAAGDVLLVRYFEILTRYFYTKVRVEDVGDLVSETFLACVTGIDRELTSGSFKALLFGIAMNKTRQYYRKRDKRRRESDDYNAVCAADSGLVTPVGLLAKRDEVRLLVRALQRLPLRQQTILELSHFEGLTGPEIAELVGAPLATVYSLLRRGKLRLAELVRELSDSPELAESTLMGIETWALQVRAQLAPAA